MFAREIDKQRRIIPFTVMAEHLDADRLQHPLIDMYDWAAGFRHREKLAGQENSQLGMLPPY